MDSILFISLFCLDARETSVKACGAFVNEYRRFTFYTFWELRFISLATNTYFEVV